MSRTSIIIPVIRPKNIEKLTKLIHKNAGLPKSEYEILTKRDRKRIGAPKMVKELVKKSKYDQVMFIGDDCLPQPDFLVNAVKTMQLFPEEWGLVGLNDMQRPLEAPPTHWLAHKNMLKHCKEFFHTGYIHQFCDNELCLWGVVLKRYKMQPKAKILHDHVGFKNKNKGFIENVNAGEDEDMKRVYSEKVFKHDQELFVKRRDKILKKFNII